MDDTHEFGPESLDRRRLHVQIEQVVPDCSGCERADALMAYLDTGEGPFEMNAQTRKEYRRILTDAADMGAFSIAMFRGRLCPFAMLRDGVVDGHKYFASALEEVKATVPPDSCEKFDDVYRRGTDINDSELDD